MTMSKLAQHTLRDRLPGFFSPAEIVVSRAPGRIDLMGGIADYSGSLVLQWPIAAATHVALQLQESTGLQICSLPSQFQNQGRFFEMPLADFQSNETTLDYDSARAFFHNDRTRRWASYIAGAFLVLMRERDCVFSRGAKILISSEVPEGKGVSSSAALEVATMMAITAAYQIEISPVEIAFLSQKVENLVAGAPCGVMDQFTAACGESNRLLALLCQPGELQGNISLPEELMIWGIDSGIRHSVAGNDYGVVRTAAFMGYRIIAELAQLTCRTTATPGRVQIKDDRWNGYLANITPVEFEKNFAAHLSEHLSGHEFLDRYQGITDTATSVAANETYPVLAATRHPIYENARVNRFADVLRNWENLEQANLLADLMYESHESYSACGLGSAGTDELVRLVREAAPARSLYGAKITGGGSGGTVAVLGNRSAGAAVEEITKLYYEYSGHQPFIISGSSAGAGNFGTVKI
jgi:galactokinase